ncbi:MAG: DUF2690 domain-containing protein [bacterium]
MAAKNLWMMLLAMLTPVVFAGCADEETAREWAADEGEAGDEVVETLEQGLCAGAACRGRDPVVTGCDRGAVTLQTRELRLNNQLVGKIELRYSAACGARWARLTNYQSSTGPYFSTRVSINGLFAYFYTGVRTSWSDMYNGVARACGEWFPCRGNCDANPVRVCTSTL